MEDKPENIAAQDLLYPVANLPSDFRRDVGLKTTPNKFVLSYLRRVVPKRVFNLDEISKQSFSLETSKAKKVDFSSKRRQPFKLSKAEGDSLKFRQFLSIHKLWIQYFTTVLGNDLSSDPNVSYQKLLKLDYHGCFMVVAKSKCWTYKGLRGIVVMETKNTFKMITREDRLLTVPKGHSVFAFCVNARVYKIYGTNFRTRPSERAKMKLKARAVLDLECYGTLI